MTEAAVALREPGNISIDLTKADKKALKVFERIQSRQDWMNYSAKAAGGVKDFTIKLLEAVKENDILVYIVMMIIVYNLMRMKFLDPITAAAINAGLVTAAGIEAILPDWLT